MFDHLRFDNRFTSELPADPTLDNAIRQVRGAAFSRVAPTAVSSPRLLAVTADLAEELGFDPDDLESEAFAQVFAGNDVLDAMDPFAMAYGGHQFGNWAGQLGDGRAIALGEVIDRHGQHQTLQLKGAGPTPYSRSADGRAVLRSSVREFLCSEAMYHLDIPTTRALSLVTTGDDVWRDMLYDGHPAFEPGAVVTRVAPSFVRFGSFEYPASLGDVDLLRTLVDFTIRNDFADIEATGPDGTYDDVAYGEWLARVVASTARLMVDWMRVGFVHGVMNTDNLSILGLTIDYGPYGWLEPFDLNWTPNTTDAAGRRYRYGAQPTVAHWNLIRLANAIVPLVGDVAPLQDAVDAYPEAFDVAWQAAMRAKLGLVDQRDGDNVLFTELISLLGQVETDMTLFFRGLADFDTAGAANVGHSDGAAVPVCVRDAYYDLAALPDAAAQAIGAWFDRYAARLAIEGLDPVRRRQAMNEVNPLYVLRNYMAQMAIDAAAEGDTSTLDELAKVLRSPFTAQPGAERWAQRRPEWARQRVGCSMLSCSS